MQTLVAIITREAALVENIAQSSREGSDSGRARREREARSSTGTRCAILD